VNWPGVLPDESNSGKLFFIFFVKTIGISEGADVSFGAFPSEIIAVRLATSPASESGNGAVTFREALSFLTPI
jgi:hypothetical protein